MNTEKKVVNRSYDSEFKSNALALLSDGRSVSSVAESLGIKASLLYSWRSQSKGSKSKQATDSSDLSLTKEIKQLKRQLKAVEEERDILKKALGIFSRGI